MHVAAPITALRCKLAGPPNIPKPLKPTTFCLHHLRLLQWQEAGGWANSSWAAAAAQRASDGVAALARLHDSYLLCRDPVLSLKLAAGLWGLSVLGSYLRCAAVGGQRGRGGGACGRAVDPVNAAPVGESGQHGVLAGRLRPCRPSTVASDGPR